MATQPLTYFEGTLGAGATYVDFAIWTNLSGPTGDVGEPWLVGGSLTDKSVQWYPQPAGGFVLEGTNDRTLNVWEPLMNPGGALIMDALTPRLQQVLINPYAIRPRVSGVTAAMTVVIFARRPRHI